MTFMPHKCQLPPPGWYCTRDKGHDGPCAAYPYHPAVTALMIEVKATEDGKWGLWIAGVFVGSSKLQCDAALVKNQLTEALARLFHGSQPVYTVDWRDLVAPVPAESGRLVCADPIQPLGEGTDGVRTTTE